MDPRHADRIKIVQNLFALSFTPEQELPHGQEKVSVEIHNNREKIDDLIQRHAPKYPLDRIAKTDLSILRLAVYELIVKPSEPSKVIINEAVELAKELGSDRSYAFINAVLGSILEEIKKEKQTE